MMRRPFVEWFCSAPRNLRREKLHFSASSPIPWMYPILDAQARRVASALPSPGKESAASNRWKTLLPRHLLFLPELLPCLDVTLSLRIRFVPLYRPVALGHQEHRQCDRAIHFGHVAVIDLLPLVADGVVIGIIERHAQRLSG